jgi:hypothetical protein
MSLRTDIEDWQESYAAVENVYTRAMERADSDQRPADVEVYQRHDDALANLAHEAAGLLARAQATEGRRR